MIQTLTAQKRCSANVFHTKSAVFVQTSLPHKFECSTLTTLTDYISMNISQMNKSKANLESVYYTLSRFALTLGVENCLVH
jgi:hypothetical protein